MSDGFQTDPPDDDMESLAVEYVLGLLTVAQMPHVVALRASNVRFDLSVQQWELRLLPLAEALDPVAPPPHVWGAISRAIAPQPARTGLWNSLNFWRYFGLGTGALGGALAVALIAAVLTRTPSPAIMATAMLASKSDGIFLATAQKTEAGLQLVVSPSQVIVPGGKSAELWLIIPGNKPSPLGLLASDRAVAVIIPAAQLAGDIRLAELAVSIEPAGGSPTGLPTGPVIAAGKLMPL